MILKDYLKANGFSIKLRFWELVKPVALLLFAISSFKSPAQILVGPVLGGKAGWVSFDDKALKDLYKAKPFFGFHGGASVSLRMQKRVFLQTSILYSQRGKTITGKIDKSLRNEARYNYIDMPILFTKEIRMRFGKGKYYNWYFGVGPNINYWLGGKGTVNSNDLVENMINPPDYVLPYRITFGKDPETIPIGEMNVTSPNRFQLGLNFSGGLVFEPLGLHKFMVTAQYELGHSFFSQDTDGDFGAASTLYYKDELQVRNQGITLSVFYFIDLKTDERNKGKSTIKLDKIRKRKR